MTLVVQCNRYGLPLEEGVLQIVKKETRPPREHEVTVQIYAADLRFTDVLQLQNKYQTKRVPPFKPGGGATGIVLQVGSAVDTLRTGDAVTVDILQDSTEGSFREELTVDAKQVSRLQPGLSFTDSLGLEYTFGTALLGLRDRGQIRPGETMLVLGAAGGVGLAAVELGKIFGARVIAAASSQERLAICRDHGADEVIDYQREDLRERIKHFTGGRGVDVVFDNVGGSLAEPCVRGLSTGGRYLVVGFTSGTIPRIPLNLVLLKSADIQGVRLGTWLQNPEVRQAGMKDLMQWLVEGRIRPHFSQEYSLEQVPEAMNDLMARRVVGRAVVVTAAFRAARARGITHVPRSSSL